MISGFYGAMQEMEHNHVTVLDADHPAVLVGHDNGPTPVEFLLHGIAACLTAGVANIAAARGVNLTKVTSTVEGDINLLGILGLSDGSVRNGYEQIKVTFHIEGDADDETLRGLVEQSRQRSAVYDVAHQPDAGRHRRRHRLTAPVTPLPGPAGSPAPAGPGTSPERESVMTRIDTVVAGAGHAGLAVSKLLTDAGHEHVVVERGRIGERWRTERWDSLRLLTPSWMTRLPGWQYRGEDAYLRAGQFASLLDRYAASFGAPVVKANVEAVSRAGRPRLPGRHRPRDLARAPGRGRDRAARHPARACQSPRRRYRGHPVGARTATPLRCRPAECSWPVPRPRACRSPTSWRGPGVRSCSRWAAHQNAPPLPRNGHLLVAGAHRPPGPDDRPGAQRAGCPAGAIDAAHRT